jgi:hypothetical protein
MHAGRAMNEQLAVWLFQRLYRKRHSTFKQFRRFGLKVIIGRTPQNFYAVWLRQRGVIEFNLHIDDVGYTHARHFRHVLFVPDAAAKPNPACNPRDIHPQFPFFPAREVKSTTSVGRYKSCLALQRLGKT